MNLQGPHMNAHCAHAARSRCPINIDLQKLWVSLRADLADEGKGPEVLNMLKERLVSSRNISFDTNQGRADWVNQVPDIP